MAGFWNPTGIDTRSGGQHPNRRTGQRSDRQTTNRRRSTTIPQQHPQRMIAADLIVPMSSQHQRGHIGQSAPPGRQQSIKPLRACDLRKSGQCSTCRSPQHRDELPGHGQGSRSGIWRGCKSTLFLGELDFGRGAPEEPRQISEVEDSAANQIRPSSLAMPSRLKSR
jgi:hypothetical protein